MIYKPIYQTEPMSLRNKLEPYQVMVLSRFPRETIMKNPVKCDGLCIHSYKKYLLRPAVCEKPSVQFSLVAQSCPTLCDPMDWSMPGLLVHHQLPEFTQTYVHWVSDTIQPPHSLSSTSPPAFNLSQHQGLFKWVSSSHQVAKVLVF